MNFIRCIVFLFLSLCISCRQSQSEKTTITSLEKRLKKHDKIVKTNCGCSSDSLINEYTTGCDTIKLKNQSILYYQFNCDSIWLTLENKIGTRKTLYKEKEYFKSFYSIQYRLKYVLRKEYDKVLLFRAGCPANGPCNFILIDKDTGKLEEELGELIYQHNPDIFYDFIVYFTGDYKSIIVKFLDTGKTIKRVIKKEDFNSIIPEYQFNKVMYSNEIITLIYDDNKTITIDINKP